MARAKIYDLDFRPDTYWGRDTASKRILANIKGAERKKFVREALDRGLAGEIEKWMLQEKLSDAVREAAGSVHPRFMGGEYLPDYRPHEVEIARVTLQSVTQDVISIRAAPATDRIKYRVVDEHDDGFKISPMSSVQPLSMKKLVRLMDTAECDGGGEPSWATGLVWGPLRMNLEGTTEVGGDPMELLGFVDLASEFYPALGQYYAQEIERFLKGFGSKS